MINFNNSLRGILTLLFTFSMFVGTALAQNTEPKDGQWQQCTCTGSPDARHENCFVAVGDKFYLLGGRGIKEVSIFNPTTNTWTSGQKPPIELHHFQGVSYKGKIYVIGAMTGRYPNEKPLSNIMIYDPKKDLWSTGDAIPENRRRGSSGVVVVGDKAIVICGIVDGHNGTHVTWVDQYDFKTGRWTILSDAPGTRDHFSAVAAKGKVYCVGGRNTSYSIGQTFELTIGRMDVYNIANNTWLTLPESNNIPTQRAGTSTVILNNNVLVIGGESGTQAIAHNEVEAYNLKTKKWRKLSNLVTGRHGTQAIVYKKAVYIAAGSGKRGGKPELDSIEKFELNNK